ncbi:cytochrome b5-like [Glandiceps talaboti]
MNSEKSPRTYTWREVRDHDNFDSCWLVILNKVYDVTSFVREHPGGEEIIMEIAGTDATVPFIDKGHSKDAYSLLAKYCIGQLVQSERV